MCSLRVKPMGAVQKMNENRLGHEGKLPLRRAVTVLRAASTKKMRDNGLLCADEGADV